MKDVRKILLKSFQNEIFFFQGMAEHMLIMSVTNPQGEEKFIVAAFPSACGKTNLAMILPTVPGYTVRVVGDDIAWMRFDKETGELRAINPEAGFFGVAP